MPYDFADGFDVYTAAADLSPSYWDSLTGSFSFTAGRFTGGRSLNPSNGTTLIKSSNVNDPVHHISCAFLNNGTVSGTALGLYFTFYDGATAQCSVVFQQGGNIVLTSGINSGTVLATYVNAAPISAVWYAFEFEVVINNTSGSFTVRRNGNTVADFTATGLNTRLSVNNYANRLQTGAGAGSAQHFFDDMYWRSSAAAGSWLGDLRCYVRSPNADVTVQFSHSTNTYTNVLWSQTGIGNAFGLDNAHYMRFIPTYSGQVNSITINCSTGGGTGHLRMALFSDNAGAIGTVLATSSDVTNPPAALVTVTFPTPVHLSAGQWYWVGITQDASINYNVINNVSNVPNTSTVVLNAPAYASWPVSNPGGTVVTSGVNIQGGVTLNFTPLYNADAVSEVQQDALTTYVYDSTVGDADFYTIGAVTTTGSTIATVTRGFMQKSDAGTRTAAVRLRSGSATVSAPTVVLTPGTWQWSWRIDVTDPNTGAAWTTAATNAVNIGPLVVA